VGQYAAHVLTGGSRPGKSRFDVAVFEDALRIPLLLTLLLYLAAIPSVRFPVFAQPSARLASADIRIMHAKVCFVPSQRLTGAETVNAYTDAAYAGRREKYESSIVADKMADLIVVNRNIFEIDPHSITETKVTTTVTGGKIVYEAQTK